MKKISLLEIAMAVNGKLVGRISPNQTHISGVSIDSRDDLSGKLFIPLKGERTDGHNFIQNAYKNGAVCCLSEKEDVDYKGAIIIVKSTYEALKNLAEYYRSKLKVKVVAITGSVGKTTTKDMIASVLMQKYNVLKTEGNYNNEIGLPLTVFKIKESHQYAVLEMGMNNFGEINNLSKIAKPDICVITNIGVTHIENLGSKENILKAKCEIFNYMKDGASVILNGDDEMLLSLKNKLENVYYYGTKTDNNIYADNVQSNGIYSISCDIHTDTDCFNVNIPFPGKHMVSNALAAAAVGIVAQVDCKLIKDGIEMVKLSKMRMDIINSECGLTIINDVYNASPASMEAAIDMLINAQSRKVCILGDMFELGEYAEEMHKQVGRYALEKEIDIIIFVGENSKFGYNASVENKINSKIYYFENKEKLFEQLQNILLKYDTILVKASRGMGFEAVVDKLKAIDLS